jgi:hypothetical protein
MEKETYSGFSAEIGYDIEFETHKIDQQLRSFSCKITMGKPVWLFPTIKNPDRKWWQIWKPSRILDPRFSDIFEAVSKA